MVKRIATALFFVFLSAQGFAKEQLRKFRWAQDPGESRGPRIPRDTSGAEALAPRLRSDLLPGVGEFVAKEDQKIGRARVVGAWKQTIYSPEGRIVYSAGAVSEKNLTIEADNLILTEALGEALAADAELKNAGKIFPPELEVKQEGGVWLPYWRVEYLTPALDELRFALISKQGRVFSRGRRDWDGVDGRAIVFPKGPKLGAPQEVPLHDLTGDGTVTGRILQVVSSLNLNVWSPELTFFFPEADPRFDLGQAYFTIDQGYRWLRDRLGVGVNHPIEVRLHVGQNGVSNAAFYHRNTIYLGRGDGETYKDLIRDPSVLIHEGIHAVIDAYAGLPSEGEGGSFNEGFADLFTALILDNPRMGEASYQRGPYRRTLENTLVAYRDFNSGVYQNGSIVGATFWDMKQSLGTELTAKLAFRTLVRLGQGARFDDFVPALRSAADGLLTQAQAAGVVRTAVARGWRGE